MGRASRQKPERREERLRGRAEAVAARSRVEQRCCLFCLQSDGGFTSHEHALPESLGNRDLVLPPGVVCDRCNNTTLSELDQLICDFFPIKMRRTMLGIASKAGKVPTTNVMTGSVEHIGPDSLRFNQNGTKPLLWESGRDADGIHLRMEASGGGRMTPRYVAKLSRAVLKAALECAWIDHGETVLEPRFDPCRAIVLGRPFDGFVALGKKGVPEHEQVSLTYDFAPGEAGSTGLWVVAAIYGVTLATASNLASPTPLMPKDKVDLITFTASDLRAA